MTARPNHFKIGLFVIAATFVLLIAIVVFGAGMLNPRKYYIAPYFYTSVHGLGRGSPVELRGVQIGQVDRIAFVGDVYPLSMDAGAFSRYERYIMVVVAVDPDFVGEASQRAIEEKLALAVSQGLRIQLANEILSGIGYLEAEFLDPERYPILDIGWQPHHTYVPSAPSELHTLKDSVDKILFKLEKLDVQQIGDTVQTLLVSLDRAVADANIPSLSRDLGRILSQAQTKLDALDVETLNRELHEVLGTLRVTLEDANVPEMTRQAKALLVQGSELDLIDSFAGVRSAFDSSSNRISIELHANVFTDQRTPDSTFEAIVVVGSARR
ncbi:MAG: MCE family protein [Gemmatimonadetes bacterium]|nr:MCE family protein [Gemmatimonadota bacterium]